MYPIAPEANALRIYSSLSCMVRINIFASQKTFLICKVASSPFKRGMATSIKITSGFICAASLTAWWPSSASAITSISGSFSSKARMPSRKIVWSSASSTFIFFIEFQCLEFNKRIMINDNSKFIFTLMDSLNGDETNFEPL